MYYNLNRPGYFVSFILVIIVSVSSWGLVRECEWSGDPPGVWRPEPDPPGDQTAAPAARHDLGWATAIRFRCHRRGCEEGSGHHPGTGKRHLYRPIKRFFTPQRCSALRLFFGVLKMDSARQLQLDSVLATQQEVLKNLNDLRWVTALLAVEVWTSCCFFNK